MDNELHAADNFKQTGEWPDPTPEMLDTILFDTIWRTIKSWDVNVPHAYSGYMGATGNHARAIYDAVLPLIASTPSRNDVLEEAGDMAEVTDVVERVARAIWTTPLLDQPEPNYVRNWPPQYPEVRDEVRNQARAALAAMLEAVGEPVGWIHKAPDGISWVHQQRQGLPAGWTETPLYSLAAFREAPPQD